MCIINIIHTPVLQCASGWRSAGDGARVHRSLVGGGSLKFNLSVGVDKTRAELDTSIQLVDLYIIYGIVGYFRRTACSRDRHGIYREKKCLCIMKTKKKYGRMDTCKALFQTPFSSLTLHPPKHVKLPLITGGCNINFYIYAYRSVSSTHEI